MMLEFTQILRGILSVFFLAPLVFWSNRFVCRRMKSNFSAFSKKKGWPLVTIINGVIYLDEILKALWSIKSSFSTVNRRATKQYWYTLLIYYRSKHEKETESFKNRFRSCDLPHQFNSLTLYALTSVRIFSTLFSIIFRGADKGNLFNNQDIYSLEGGVFECDSEVKLQGEIRCQSLLGSKGLTLVT